ncbi:MAG: hypothetical protein M3R38_00460 [Actinomycetota bacterium]|nr:hypothetical protein [Actinomycetota bacterium]
MGDKVSDTLRQLGTSFTVRDIMVPLEDLVLIDSESEAQCFFDKYEDFDYTASRTRGQITTYYKRGEPEGFDLGQEDLLSDGTSLLDLLDLMVGREFFFVLSANRVCGFVHFSDLNHELVKLPLFVLLAAVESHLWLHVKEGLTEDDVEYLMDPDRFHEVVRRRKEAREGNVDRGWEGLLYFREILELARNHGLIETPATDQELLNDTRNRVAHHNRLLVERHEDVRELARIRNLCQELMRANPY